MSVPIEAGVGLFTGDQPHVGSRRSSPVIIPAATGPAHDDGGTPRVRILTLSRTHRRTEEYEMTMTSDLQHSITESPRARPVTALPGSPPVSASSASSAGNLPVQDFLPPTICPSPGCSRSSMTRRAGCRSAPASRPSRRLALVLFGAHVRHLLLRREPRGRDDADRCVGRGTARGGDDRYGWCDHVSCRSVTSTPSTRRSP